jgi:ferredoxin
VLRAPRIFDQREDGMVILVDAAPPQELHDAARKAADLCPAQAITIEAT